MKDRLEENENRFFHASMTRCCLLDPINRNTGCTCIAHVRNECHSLCTWSTVVEGNRWCSDLTFYEAEGATLKLICEGDNRSKVSESQETPIAEPRGFTRP